MKIEKVNDNQIRCTLTREDLEDRHIKISELAYGSAKAKSLFKDMVEQANYEFGFETNDIPLMVKRLHYHIKGDQASAEIHGKNEIPHEKSPEGKFLSG